MLIKHFGTWEALWGICSPVFGIHVPIYILMKLPHLSLPGPHYTVDIFKVKSLKIKVMDSILKNALFGGGNGLPSKTVCCQTVTVHVISDVRKLVTILTFKIHRMRIQMRIEAFILSVGK